ncbi:MAG: RNA polymerase sigma factor [Polyangiaceae bacterium]
MVHLSGPKLGPGLVERLRAGDEAAFRELIDAYHARLIRLALGFVETRAAAEEVVQDTWLGVVKGLPTFEQRASLKTWIFSILINRARSRGAREGRHRDVFVDQATVMGVGATDFTAEGRWSSPPTPWETPLVERALSDRRALERLAEALDQLPQQQRAVVVLRDVEGLDGSEVCNVLGITETNQRVLLHRGRTRLRAVLADVIEDLKGC